MEGIVDAPHPCTDSIVDVLHPCTDGIVGVMHPCTDGIVDALLREHRNRMASHYLNGFSFFLHSGDRVTMGRSRRSGL